MKQDLTLTMTRNILLYLSVICLSVLITGTLKGASIGVSILSIFMLVVDSLFYNIRSLKKVSILEELLAEDLIRFYKNKEADNNDA